VLRPDRSSFRPDSLSGPTGLVIGPTGSSLGPTAVIFAGCATVAVVGIRAMPLVIRLSHQAARLVVSALPRTMPTMAVDRTSLSATGALELAPFRGVRYDPAYVSDLAAVTSPPYDVIEPDRVPMLETADPHNVVRLILPRDDVDHSAGRYRHAAAALTSWLQSGVLTVDPEPALYVYEQVTAISVQRGLIGALGLRQPDERVILPHEDHMPGPVADRLELMRAARASLEPILLAYEGGGPASAAVEARSGSRRSSRSLLPTGSGTGCGGSPMRRCLRLLRPTSLPAGADRRRPPPYATYLRLQAECRRRNGPGAVGLRVALWSIRPGIRSSCVPSIGCCRSCRSKTRWPRLRRTPA
jgi:hypothetical protein